MCVLELIFEDLELGIVRELELTLQVGARRELAGAIAVDLGAFCAGQELCELDCCVRLLGAIHDDNVFATH